MPIQARPGPGWAVSSGDTKQRLTKEVAQRPSAGAPFLLGTYFWANKNKFLAREGRNPHIKCEAPSNNSAQHQKIKLDPGSSPG
jgi:hypothetical protein